MATDAVLIAEPARLIRRWYHFRPAALLLLLSVLCVGLGWLCVNLKQLKETRRREQVERALLAAGGWSCDKYRIRGQDWIWARMTTDAGLEALKDLPQVQILDLTDSQVTDAGLVHLEKLSNLQRLYLDGCEVSDAGLGHIKKLPQLRIVYLYATQVTERGVRKLHTALPSLTIRW